MQLFDGAPGPPVVAYSPDLLALATVELDLLPAGSAIEQMLADLSGDAGSGAGVRALRRVSGVARLPRHRGLAVLRAPARGQRRRRAFIRTLKENLLWVRHFETIEALRLALLEFADWYNSHWLAGRPRPGTSSMSPISRGAALLHAYPMPLTSTAASSSPSTGYRGVNDHLYLSQRRRQNRKLAA